MDTSVRIARGMTREQKAAALGAALWVVSINVFQSLRALEYETEDLHTERIARGLRFVTLLVMCSVAAPAIPRPLSAGADRVDDRDPESPRSRVLASLLPLTQHGMRPISCWCHALIMHWT